MGNAFLCDDGLCRSLRHIRVRWFPCKLEKKAINMDASTVALVPL